jgi:hypothetical protein
VEVPTEEIITLLVALKTFLSLRAQIKGMA